MGEFSATSGCISDLKETTK